MTNFDIDDMNDRQFLQLVISGVIECNDVAMTVETLEEDYDFESQSQSQLYSYYAPFLHLYS
jgi:hypothetical protein